jgi:hypothetical protein
VVMAHPLLQYDSVKLYFMNAKPIPVCSVTATQIESSKPINGYHKTRKQKRSCCCTQHAGIWHSGDTAPLILNHRLRRMGGKGGFGGQQYTPVALPTAQEVSVTIV